MYATLTSAEFASVSDGDEVWVDGAYFGCLDKHKLKMTQDLQGTKEIAGNILTQARANVTDPQRLAELDNLIQQVKESFAPIYWLDRAHLQPSTGETMFSKDIELVSALVNASADPANTPAEQDALDRAGYLVADADCTAVSLAIEDAKVAGVTTEIIDSAVKTRKWARPRAPESYPVSISSCRSAWLTIIRAIYRTPTPAQ
jgi:hypothetical protein